MGKLKQAENDFIFWLYNHHSLNGYERSVVFIIEEVIRNNEHRRTKVDEYIIRDIDHMYQWMDDHGLDTTAKNFIHFAYNNGYRHREILILVKLLSLLYKLDNYHGYAKWIPIKPTVENNFIRFECSGCHLGTYYDYPYCPHCGREIVGYDEENDYDIEIEFSSNGIGFKVKDDDLEYKQEVKTKK